jgi:predicted GNAT family N-acyltransferase
MSLKKSFEQNRSAQPKTSVIQRLPPEAADPKRPSQAYQTCLEIRRIVFIKGQSVPVELEFDGLDQHATHFLAFDEQRGSRTALGTARMRIVDGIAKAERIAVLEDAREKGFGRALVEAIEVAARETGLSAIRLNAQIQALRFYEKLGFVAGGDVFIEAGIDHCQMTKRLI